MKNLNKLFFPFFLSLFTLFEVVNAKDKVENLFVCNLLLATVQECRSSAYENKIFKDPDSCNSLSLMLMGASIYTLSKNQTKSISEDIIKVGEVLGKVCYKACMDENEFINRILEDCR